MNLARRLRPEQRFVNAYGPTETTVVATAHISAPSDAGSDVVPIGTALPFARVYVLDEAHEPVQDGEVGEIYIGGAGVTRGYLGMPGITADRFVPDPRAVTPGARMYRTGDLGRVLDDGELEFRGRTDHQVKIHGYRIELTEVERALEAHPGVAQAAVLVNESQAAGTQLHGFVVCAGANQVTDLREFLAERLPRYLIPHALVPVAAFPLTSNGKVDRAALAQTDATASARPRAYVPASGSSEEAIAQIWAQVLRVPQVGRLDIFTELGGDSLAAGKIAERIRGVLGVDLPLRVFFDGAVTVGGLAAAVESGEFTASSNPVARIPRRIRPS